MAGNIVLIGMPGAGKSTLGVSLAKHMALNFIDTDILLQTELGCSLEDFLDNYGYELLRQREEQMLLKVSLSSATVLSTGGSAIYSAPAMQKLARWGRIVYLKISLSTLLERVKNAESRGLAAPPGTALKDLYAEREPLYRKYAHLVFENDLKKQNDALEQLVTVLA